jgi:hypothetical protein
MPPPALSHRRTLDSYTAWLAALFVVTLVLLGAFVAIAVAKARPERRLSGRTVYALVNTETPLDLAFLRGAIEARKTSRPLPRVVVLDVRADQASVSSALCRVSEPILCNQSRPIAQRQIILGPSSTTQVQTLVRVLTAMCEAGTACGQPTCEGTEVVPGKADFNVAFILGDVTMNDPPETATCDCACRAHRTLQFVSRSNREEAEGIATRVKMLADRRPGKVVILKQAWPTPTGGAASGNQGYVDQIAADLAVTLEAALPGRVEQLVLASQNGVVADLNGSSAPVSVLVPVTDETDGAREVIESLVASHHRDVPIVAPDTWTAATVQRRWQRRLRVCAMAMREADSSRIGDRIDAVRRSFGADAYSTFEAATSGRTGMTFRSAYLDATEVHLGQRPIWKPEDGELHFRFTRDDDCLKGVP